MDKATIILENGTEKTVDCIFYLYDSKYYFLYTDKEVEENDYIKLYIVKVGKETKNTETGLIETGNMVGIEIPTNDEWKKVQESISKIVNSKKSKIEDADIRYLPINMLSNLRIVSKKSFKLLSSIIENNFGVFLNRETEENVHQDQNEGKLETKEGEYNQTNVISSEALEEIKQENEENLESNIKSEDISSGEAEEDIDQGQNEENLEISEEEYNQGIIIDYRTRFFEEQEKNKNLKQEIEKLEKKLDDISEIIKGN